ncbi:hypothetical protein M407DRAFT_86092, partial [Tulasnella calospora MUT 4182]
ALRESKVVLELSHPNIVKLEGFVADLSKNVVWLVFPWEENGNLKDFLAAGDWEVPERISLIYDVTRGVEYLHTQKPPIYHSDLKSLNILVNLKFLAIITDFGSARRLQKGAPLRPVFCASTNTITLTGSKYTIRWAAPEQLTENQSSLASDIWSLGWIVYEVMTNSIPFHDITVETTVMRRVIQGDLPFISADARMSLIRALCSLVTQCWSFDPNKRPTAEDCRKSISWMVSIAIQWLRYFGLNQLCAALYTANDYSCPEPIHRYGGVANPFF